MNKIVVSPVAEWTETYVVQWWHPSPTDTEQRVWLTVVKGLPTVEAAVDAMYNTATEAEREGWGPTDGQSSYRIVKRTDLVIGQVDGQ